MADHNACDESIKAERVQPNSNFITDTFDEPEASGIGAKRAP